MILDRSNINFSKDDLKHEWLNKMKQFDETITIVGEKASILLSYIKLCKTIYESELCYSLFPGEKMDRLNIYTTINSRIDYSNCLTIQQENENRNAIEFIHIKYNQKKEVESKWTFVCSETNIIETFYDFLEKNIEFKRNE